MPFLPNIPQANDQLSVSQADILNNFMTLGAIAGNANPGSASLNGTVGFNFLNLANQGGTIPSITPTYNGIFCANVTPGNFQETFVLNYSTVDAIDVVIPMTNSVRSVGTPISSGAGTRGWAYLPSGILIKWGQISNVAVAGYPRNVPFNAGGNEPAFIQGPLIPYVTPTVSPANSASMPIGTLTAPNLVISLGVGASGTQGAYWMMIGY